MPISLPDRKPKDGVTRLIRYDVSALDLNKGDEYSKQAGAQRGSNVIRATFPKPGRKTSE
jgi:hypothetical protein